MTHPCLRAVGAAIALALVTIVPATGQEARPTGQEVRPDAERAREMVFKPELSQEQTAQLATLRKKKLACPGQFPTPTIAVSVAGNWLGNGGTDTILNYSTVITNVGGAWIASSVFLAPCTGHYFFTVSFVKDTYYSCGGQVGTQDDVAVYLTRSSSTGVQVIGPAWTNGAWSGEDAGRRGTGAFGVAVRLNQNDAVQSWVHSDGGRHRCLAAYNFTGFRIGK
jgi:C1q-related factor